MSPERWSIAYPNGRLLVCRIGAIDEVSRWIDLRRVPEAGICTCHISQMSYPDLYFDVYHSTTPKHTAIQDGFGRQCAQRRQPVSTCLFSSFSQLLLTDAFPTAAVAATSNGMMSKSLPIARTTLATPSWPPWGGGSKVRIYSGTREARTMRRPKPNESVMRFNASRTPSRRPWRLPWASLYRRKARVKTQIWSRWVGRMLRKRFRIRQPTMKNLRSLG